MKLNENYFNLKESYLFSRINQKIKRFSAENPDKKIISLGIGDVTQPLGETVISALHEAVSEMGIKETFRGYGNEGGYDFLKQGIQSYYKKREVTLELDEIFVSDGAKSDVGNILDLFGGSTVLILDPVYPVYQDTNIMAGNKIVYLNANESNGFLPEPDESIDADIVYICSPNNPTGAVYTYKGLKQWVDYASNKGAIILFDAAYEAFISDSSLPKSIFEIEGAKKCAIEFCSLSKTAGFTGTRCGYTVISMELEFSGQSLNKLWLRRQTTKFNGVSYIIQRGAAAVFSEQGQEQVKKTISVYQQNARVILRELADIGIWFTGGQHSPYIWFKIPKCFSSWEFFDFILHKAAVVGTPGSGFGANGEGFFRLTSFGSQDGTVEAMKRIRSVILDLEPAPRT